MKSRIFAIVVSLLLPFAALAADVPWAQGTLQKLDKAGAKATIAHGPIDSIGMGPMTMMFAVKDATGLAKLKEGDKVRFQAVMAGGDIVVTRIEALK
jgi:Cu(I)/Ag(I) efflux system periplasmic protein CusF